MHGDVRLPFAAPPAAAQSLPDRPFKLADDYFAMALAMSVAEVAQPDAGEHVPQSSGQRWRGLAAKH